MSRDNDLRAAGDRINQSGLADAAPRIGERDLGDRSSRRNPRNSRRAREDDGQDEGLNFDGEEDLDEDRDGGKQRGSNRSRGESDDDADDDDGEADDADDDDEDRDDGDEDRDADSDDEADEDESPANLLDREFEVKVNGETEKLPLKEIIRGYQRDADYRQKTGELSVRRRALEDGHKTVAADYDRRLRITAGAMQQVHTLLVGDMNSQAMQQLRHTDPQEWAVQRSIMQERIDKINGILNQVVSEQERHVRERENSLQAAQAQALPNEEMALLRYIPDWQTKGKKRLSEYLVKFGFDSKELAGVYDHRMLAIAEKARLYDAYKATQQTAKAKKTPKQAPKQRPPEARGGSSIRRQDTQVKRQRRGFSEAKSKARKTGDMRDAGRAIAYMIDD